MSNMAINTEFSTVIEIFRSGVCPHFCEVSPLPSAGEGSGSDRKLNDDSRNQEVQTSCL